MRSLLASLAIGAALAGGAAAEGPARPTTGTACKPAVEPPLPDLAARTPLTEPALRSPVVSGIAEVVGAGATWTEVWRQGGNSADGILPDADRGVLVAQEDYDTVLRIGPDGTSSVAVAGAKGIGSLSMDRRGRLYGAHRTERPGSAKPDRTAIVNAITELAPRRATITDKWDDGGRLTVRPNDLAADSRGGVYFTSGCLYYADAKGTVVAADNLRTNGIAFSPDDKMLYVTNGPAIVAFDVAGPGRLANRRDLAALDGPGDGLAVDSRGRIYATTPAGVQVLDRSGRRLGLIETPRAVISVTFAGPGRRTLYVVGSGAEDAAGRHIHEGPQLTAATVYRLPMLAEGLEDRAK